MLTPVLVCVYLDELLISLSKADELLISLSKAGIGYYIGSNFDGALVEV